MTPTLLTYFFIGLLSSTTFIRIWLGIRQIKYIHAHRLQVPNAFSEKISLAAHQKAADYSSEKTQLGLTELVVQALLLVLLTIGSGLQWIDNIWMSIIPTYPIVVGALVICTAMLVSSLIDLPFDYYKIDVF